MIITLDNWISADKRQFNLKEDRISKALKGETGILDGVVDKNKEDIFYMLCFCLCVPQSRANLAEKAVDLLRKKLFFSADLEDDDVGECLRTRVRFPNSKLPRLMDSKKMFLETDFWDKLQDSYSSYCNLAKELRFGYLKETRIWLTKTVNGMGLKLSSHFLRNIGMSGLAILDVHIIAGMEKRDLIPDEYFVTNKLGKRKIDLSKNHYYDIEDRMRGYAEEVGISVDELDLLLWSQRTGYVFK